jgi:hypothetical protein
MSSTTEKSAGRALEDSQEKSEQPRKARRIGSATLADVNDDVCAHQNDAADEKTIIHRMVTQRDESNKVLAAFFPEHFDLTSNCGPDRDRAVVRAGEGVFEIDESACEALIRYFTSLPEHRRKKGFVKIGFETLLGIQECRPFLNEWKRLTATLRKFYRIANAGITVSIGNSSLMHQVQPEGIYWSERADCKRSFAEGSVPSLRVLFDVAAFPPNAATPPRRSMIFKVNNKTVVETEARFVAIDMNAPGSGQQSNILHGHVGDGITATFDIGLLSERGCADVPLDADRHTRDFFHGTGVAEPSQPGSRYHQAKYTVDVLHDKLDEAQARAANAAALVQRGEWPLERRHCWRCGSHETRVTDGCEKWHGRGEDENDVFCDACRHDVDRAGRRSVTTTWASYGTAEPEVVRLFFCPPGCTGCIFVPRPKWESAASKASKRAHEAEAASRVADADEPLVLDEPHCHFCGAKLRANVAKLTDHWHSAVLDDSDPPQQVAMCLGCRKQFLVARQIPHRHFSCAPQCTGCRRPLNRRLTAAEAARERTQKALAGRDEPEASAAPHCHACGDPLPAKSATYLRKAQLRDDAGVWLLHCSACIKRSTKNDLERLYHCPSSCSGCRCRADEEVKSTVAK